MADCSHTLGTPVLRRRRVMAQCDHCRDWFEQVIVDGYKAWRPTMKAV